MSVFFMTLAQVAECLDQSTPPASANIVLDGINTDSRKVQANSLFIALVGDNFDAHDFLEDAIKNGAVAALVSKPVQLSIPTILVPDTLGALQQLAAMWREQFAIPVVGIMGSNGKTTSKEMVAAIIRAHVGVEHCLVTAGNLNNHIGVPLTLLQLRSHHQAAVIEMGMNHPGETADLMIIAQPTISLITNAQREHQEFMVSVDAVAEEHAYGILGLPSDGVAVFPHDDERANVWRKAAGRRRVIESVVGTFSAPSSASVFVESTPNAEGQQLAITTPTGSFSCTLAIAGAHNAHNAGLAVAVALAMSIPLTTIAQGLENFAPANGRMQYKKSSLGATIIDDSYNANPDSVRAAIDVLATMPAPRVFVLGDMGEVGDFSQQFHREVVEYAQSKHIEYCLALGAAMLEATQGQWFFQGHDMNLLQEKLRELSPSLGAQATYLIKGSRFMRMERAITAL